MGLMVIILSIQGIASSIAVLQNPDIFSLYNWETIPTLIRKQVMADAYLQINYTMYPLIWGIWMIITNIIIPKLLKI